MRRFWLVRDEDETGVSGTGVVAVGVAFPNGKAAISWKTEHTSTAVYDSMRDVEAIHGHNGLTRIVWVDGRRLRDELETPNAMARDSMGYPIRKGSLVLPLAHFVEEREPFVVIDEPEQREDGTWWVTPAGWLCHGGGPARTLAHRVRVVGPPR